MTVIAFDGRTIASDGLSVAGFRDAFSDAAKFRLPKRGVIVATAGTEIWSRRFDHWVARGKTYPLVPDTEEEKGLGGQAALFRNGRWHKYYSDAPTPEHMGSKWALGSGAGYAMTALVLGHDAVTSCWAAMQLDTHCGASIWYADVTELIRVGNDAIRRSSAAPTQTWPQAQADHRAARA
jgi:hypothetical protein